MNNPVTGLFMLGGGVPKNFAQDIVVAADILMAQDEGKHEYPEMHKYAIQVTVADVRDGALSSSTLKEASSWGKVDTTYEQMVYQRSHARRAADRRLRLSQARLGAANGQALRRSLRRRNAAGCVRWSYAGTNRLSMTRSRDAGSLAHPTNN